MPAPKLLRPLVERDFRLLWIGQSISLLGDGFMIVALAWQTYEISPHASSLSYVFLARSIPQVGLLIFGGAFVDRLPRRAVMLTADVARGLVVGAVAILAATGALELWHLMVMSAVLGAASAFFNPASTAIFPEVLPPEWLLPGNALRSASQVVAQNLAGPALGGLTVAAVGTAWAFGLDAASFIVSAACLLGMRSRSAPPPEPTGIWNEIGQGLSYVRRTRWILVTLVAAGACNLLVGVPYTVLAPLFVKTVLHAGPAGLGIVFASGGVGGVLAALVLGQWGATRRNVTAMYATWTLGSACMAAVALTQGIALAAVLAAGFGFGFTAGNLVWETLIQREVPPEMMGRVSSLDWLMSLGLQPIGYALAGPIVAALGLGATMVGGGVLGALVMAGSLFVPGVRDPERRHVTE